MGDSFRFDHKKKAQKAVRSVLAMSGSNGSGLEQGLEVSTAQEELVRLNLHVKSLNSDFENVSSHREMSDLNTEIRRQMESMRRLLKVLRDLAVKQKFPKLMNMLMNDVENHADQITSLQASFKQSNMRCISRLDASGRDLLMGGAGGSDGGTSETSSADPSNEVRQRQRKQMDREEAVRQSGQATDKLAAISRQLADTVERSSVTVGTLAESSATVTETRDEFAGLGSIVGQSRRLITKYARRETTDKVLILFATAFFFAVVFYILRKRVLGPLDPFALLFATIKSLVVAIVKIIRTVQNYVTEALL